MFYSDVSIHHQITPASISAYHASKYVLVLMFFSDVPIHCQITPISISTYQALKYFLVLMLFSDMPIHPQITPASVSTFHASKHFQFVMLFSYVPIYCQITALQTSTELCCTRRVVCVLPGPHGLCFASFSLSATSTSTNKDSSCSEESKFLAWVLYASPSPFLISDASRIWTTYASSPRLFSASSSVSATSSSAKECSSWSYQSNFFAPASYASSFLFLFLESSFSGLPSCVSAGFFLSVPFLQLALFCHLLVLKRQLKPWTRQSELQAIVTSEASKLSKSTLRPNQQPSVKGEPSPVEMKVVCSFDGPLPTIQGSPLSLRTEIIGEVLIYRRSFLPYLRLSGKVTLILCDLLTWLWVPWLS